MVYRLVLFAARKPGLSIDEFRNHWENKHVPLLKSISGSTFPLSHTRRYIGRIADGTTARAGVSPVVGSTSESPAILVGRLEDIDWDGFAELIFKDELHFQQFFAKVNDPKAAEQIQEDEARFTDSEKLKVIIVGECTTTTLE